MSKQKKKKVTPQEFLENLKRLRKSKTLSEIGEMLGGIGPGHVRQILLGYVQISDKVLASWNPPMRKVVYYEPIASDTENTKG